MSHPRTPTRVLSLAAAAVVVPLALTACSGNQAEIDAACADIQSNISAVDLAAESIATDVLVDDVPFQDDHYSVLDAHVLDVERLEEAARGDLSRDATERADAVNAVLEELDFGDHDGLADALDWTSDTHDMILAACDY
ncbi:hypothetical protein [Nocardiopsis prasina]|uniref:hypothetical protein n=1 Tax=Nocardiopsis prasina TaxID=2015 RepID=UPI000345D7B3|nr:hypothetical protein [Nocardiopsis prasina]